MMGLRSCFACGHKCKSKGEKPVCQSCARGGEGKPPTQHASPASFRFAAFCWDATTHAIREYEDGWAVAYCSRGPTRCSKPVFRPPNRDDCRECVKAIRKIGKEPRWRKGCEATNKKQEVTR